VPLEEACAWEHNSWRQAEAGERRQMGRA